MRVTRIYVTEGRFIYFARGVERVRQYKWNWKRYSRLNELRETYKIGYAGTFGPNITAYRNLCQVALTQRNRSTNGGLEQQDCQSKMGEIREENTVMGWAYGWNSKKELVEHLTHNWTGQDGVEHKTIASASVGKTLWVVKTGYEGGNIILCNLIEKKGEWGYKGMSESVHPYYYSCPLSFLDFAPIACQEWRDGVIKWHIEQDSIKRKTKAIVEGQVISLLKCSIPEVKITSVKPLRGVYNGITYRIPKKVIGEMVNGD